MPRKGQTLRVLAWVTAGLCVAVLTPTGAIRVDQYLLRRKAELLLSDLKSLEMRKSTYHDARQVIDRWKDSIHAAGTCQPNRCDAEIGVSDYFDRHWDFFVHHRRLMQVWRVLGGRPSVIDGFIRVRRNVVWGKGIRAIVLGYSADSKDNVNLIARMGSGSPGFISLIHPEYDVGLGRNTTGTSSRGAYADFTPYADPVDVNRLMDIDFSCLTRWNSCETGADIAPAAWREATAEKDERMATKSGQLVCSAGVVRVLARESRRAVIGEVNRISLYAGLHDAAGFAQVKILFKSDLKQSNLASLSSLQDYSFNESLPVKEKVGDRFILFFRYQDQLYSDNERACQLLPPTQANTEAAGRGIAEDWADHDDQF